LLELLYNLHMWRGTPQIDRQIIEGFGHLAAMSGLGTPHLARELAHRVWEICWHFVGPHHVKMDRNGFNLVVRCADVVESLATYNCLMQRDLCALRATLGTAENLFDVAVSYKNEKIAMAVLNTHKKALATCRREEAPEFQRGSTVLLRSAKALSSKLKRSRLKWPNVVRTLRTFKSHATPSSR
jgi:hypothetical protein